MRDKLITYGALGVFLLIELVVAIIAGVTATEKVRQAREKK
jgi:cell division protein FtsL